MSTKLKKGTPVRVVRGTTKRNGVYLGQEDRGEGRGQGVYAIVNVAPPGSKEKDVRYVRPSQVVPK